MSDYQNGHVSLGDIVGAYLDHNDLKDAAQLSVEQLHDLAGLITDARHDSHGVRPATREVVVLANRDKEVYREEIFITNGNVEGEK